MDDELKLQDIFDMQVWQKIQDSFAKSTGYAAIIVDKNGIPLLDYSNFSDYCLELRESSKCRSCYISDAQGGLIASKAKKPVIYKCHGKLIDFAVPIIVQGEYMGAILAGQTRLYPDEEHLVDFDVAATQKISKSDQEIFDSPELQELYKKTHISHYSQVVAAAELLYTLANHLSEMKLFNLMQERLSLNESELNETTKKQTDVESFLKTADLEALHAQTKPHFLFNVLNTIGRLAMFEGAEQTEELVYQFSDLMRYTLSRNAGKSVTIAEEMDHVRTYLSIQKYRLQDRLEYSINIEPGASEVECPAMIIQPFIENFVNHVVEPRVEGGCVQIDVHDHGEEVEIVIQDNGDGIPKEVVEALLEDRYESKGERTGLGINNVNKRLMYYYGTDYGVCIDESESNGTKIVMRIPKGSLEV